MSNTYKRQRIDLTPEELAKEIPQSLLPVTCGPLSAKAYRDNQVRPLVWLLFGGTGALGKQISRTAIARRDRVFIAALDEADIDCDFPLEDDMTQDNQADSLRSDSSSKNNTRNNHPAPSHQQQPHRMGGPSPNGKDAAHSPNSTSSSASQTRRSSSTSSRKRTRIVNPEPSTSAPEIGYLYVDERFKNLCYRVKCDVRIRESVDRAVQRCLQVFGRIDVVVNCFGYGVMGACEEQFDTEIRSQFETNLMGLFHTIRAVLPYLTNAARMSANDKVPNDAVKKGIYKDNVNSNAPITSTPGHIISFTSSMGVLGTPGFGPYSATRWAAEGLLESLSFEVEHLGCKVTIIETGYAKSGSQEDDSARVART